MTATAQSGTASVENLGPVASRSALYLFFARCFSHPEEDFLSTVQSGALLEQLKALGADLPYATPFEIHDDLGTKEITAAEIKTRFTSYFEVGNAAVSIRESRYVRKSEQELYEELFRFYEFFGLEFPNGALTEAPDLLSVELEFMRYLTFLEAGLEGGDIEALSSLKRAQADFLSRHLAQWVSKFADRVEKIDEAAPYDKLARLLSHFVEAELAFTRE